MPPFSAPDESTHYNSAYRISNNWLGVENQPGLVVKRECDTVQPFTDFHTSAYTYRHILEHFGDSADGQEALVACREEYLTGYQLPRLIPAIGITAARLLGWGGVLTAYFARFLCLMSYAALTALACHWLIAALSKQDDKVRLILQHRLVYCGLFLLTLGMLVAACITWTPMSCTYIWGFQGRYLLPVLPCLMLAIRPSRIIRTDADDTLVLGAVWTLHVMAVLNVLTVVLSR